MTFIGSPISIRPIGTQIRPGEPSVASRFRRSSASSRFRCSQRPLLHSGGMGGGAGCLRRRWCSNEAFT